ncbi:MAG TPA: tetratricopeptide repeat protein [Ktedonobacteraceae bacterium]
MGKRLGLIIGINSYQDTTFQPLQYAETDAKAFAQWLVHNRGGNWNPADVQVLQGESATRELVESLISQLCLNMATSEDMILIYFAGYAFVDQVSGDGYLACSNSRYQQSGSGLKLLALVSQILARSPAAQVLCILDCFQFGSVWNMRRGSPFDYKPLLGPTLMSGLQQMQGRLLYCTCRGNEAWPELSERNLGSFMYRAIMGGGGPARDAATGQVTLQSLHTFLSERLTEQHRPQIFGQEARPVVLVGEMPSFKTGALQSIGARADSTMQMNNGPLAGGMLPPSGPLNAQTMQMPGSPVAQLSPNTSGLRPVQMDTFSPSTSSLGQPAMAMLEQQRMQQMLSQAMQTFQAQNLPQAYQMTETILQMNPTFTDALILKAQILAAGGQFQEALQTVQETVQSAPDNALGWSMAAALLANLGQLPEAMSAVDRSISIDPSNSETHSIKEMIREKLASVQFDTGKRSRLQSNNDGARDSGKGLATTAGIQVIALIIGVGGSFLPMFVSSLPTLAALGLESIALALLTVTAARGSFLYGVKRFLLAVLFSLIAAGLGAGFYVLAIKPTLSPPFLLDRLARSYSLLPLFIFLIIWLGAAAAVPLLAGLIGLIAGTSARSRRKKK